MKVGIRKSSAKEFIAQPDPVGVDNIALAIFGNLADVTVAVVLLDLAATLLAYPADPLRGTTREASPYLGN